jgi:uncharacterized membrane-anchored protein YitT (DUF2179 family)
LRTNTRPKRPPAAPPDYPYILMSSPVLLLASVIAAMGVNLFLVPAELAPGGVIGVGIIIESLVPFPIGLTVFLGNIVLLAIGYRELGGWNIVIMSAIFATAFAINIELTRHLVPAGGISDERLLNALYGGVVGGIAGGMVYRTGATMGGSSVLTRMLNNRFGIPTSSGYLYVDSIVILLAGLTFGWEASLFSLVTLVVDGFVADYVLEGPSLIRIVTVITDKPVSVSNAIMAELSRGVTSWTGQGRYTNQSHEVLFVTVARSQVSHLQRIVNEADPYAFVVIGHGHVAYGGGFKGKGRAGRLPRRLQPVSTLFQTTEEPESTIPQPYSGD